jgi:hypothetical protein
VLVVNVMLSSSRGMRWQQRQQEVMVVVGVMQISSSRGMAGQHQQVVVGLGVEGQQAGVMSIGARGIFILGARGRHLPTCPAVCLWPARACLPWVAVATYASVVCTCTAFWV